MKTAVAVGTIAHTTFGPWYGLLVDSLGIVAHLTRQLMRDPSTVLTLARALRGTPLM